MDLPKNINASHIARSHIARSHIVRSHIVRSHIVQSHSLRHFPPNPMYRVVKSAMSLEDLQVVQGSTDEQFLREALLEFEEIAQAMRGKDIALGLNRLVS